MSETPNVENETEVTENATSVNEETEAVEAAAEAPAAQDAAPDAAAEGTEADAAAAEPEAPVDSAPAHTLASEDDEEFVAEPTTFNVSNRIEEKVIDGRLEAVAHAKEWSVESGQSISVERTDGRVQMSFRDGALVDYVLETRKGRKS